MWNCARCNAFVDRNQWIMYDIGDCGEGEYVPYCNGCKELWEASGIHDKYREARDIYEKEFKKFSPYY